MTFGTDIYLATELCRVNSGFGNGPSVVTFGPYPRPTTAAERDIINLYSAGDIGVEECEALLAAQPDPFGFRGKR